jgi:hypothetical protein
MHFLRPNLRLLSRLKQRLAFGAWLKARRECKAGWQLRQAENLVKASKVLDGDVPKAVMMTQFVGLFGRFVGLFVGLVGLVDLEMS